MQHSSNKILIILAGILILIISISIFSCSKKNPVAEKPEVTDTEENTGTVGKIQGTIVDKTSQEPIPGANVILVGTEQGAATNIEGHFIILNISPGIYELKVSMPGYKQAESENIQVSVNQSTQVNFELEIDS